VVVACAGDFPAIPCAVPVLLPGFLAAAVMQRSAVALVVLDCMGHDEGYRAEFARLSGRPTLAIQALAAGIAGGIAVMWRHFQAGRTAGRGQPPSGSSDGARWGRVSCQPMDPRSTRDCAPQTGGDRPLRTRRLTAGHSCLALAGAAALAATSPLAAQGPVATLGPAAAPIPQAHMALTHANVVDVRDGRIIPDTTVVVRDGTIVSVGATAAPAGATVIDLAGRWLLPGLIDVHTHLETTDAARRALMSGVTTVRSASVGFFQDVALREMVKAGYLAGPDVLAAGLYVTRDDPSWLADPRMIPLWPKIDTADRLRRMVQINKDRGADVIKTRGTERAGRPDTDPREQVYSEADLRAVVDEATRLGLDVLCHTHGTEGSEAAIRAGVRSIEHGTYLTPAQLRTMKAKNIFWVPTYSTLIDLVEPGGDYDDPVVHVRGRFMLPVLRAAFKEAVAIGVKIATGADSGYGPASVTRIGQEATNFVEMGMTPLQAVQAATSVAADLLRLDARVGTVAEGFEADLIAVEANPLVDIRALQDPLLVISNGRLALNRLQFGR